MFTIVYATIGIVYIVWKRKKKDLNIKAIKLQYFFRLQKKNKKQYFFQVLFFTNTGLFFLLLLLFFLTIYCLVIINLTCISFIRQR